MRKDQKILITGATGLVGSHVTRLLFKEGYEKIRCVKRSQSRLELVSEVNDRIEWCEGDISDPFFCSDILQGIDIVIHAAGLVSFEKKNYDQLMDVNYSSTRELVHASMESGIQHFIYISSIAALGRSEPVEKIDETTIWRRSKLNSDYAVSKYLGEMEVWKANAEGLRTTTLNPSVILGAGFWGQGSLIIFDKVWNGLRLYPKGQTGWVDVRDVAKAVISIIENQIYGKRIIINACNARYKEILTLIAEAMQKSAPRIHVQSWMAEIAWRSSHVLSSLTGSKPFVEKSVARVSQNSYTYENSLSRELLNLDYADISQTISDSVTQFLESKKQNLDFAILPFKR